MSGGLEARAKQPPYERADIQLGFGTYRLTGRSALSSELLRLPPRVRQVLCITPLVVVALDMVITMARVLTDDGDPRSYLERLEEIMGQLPEFDDPEMTAFLQQVITKAGQFAADPKAEQKLQRIFKRYTSSSYLGVARRLVGAAAFDRVQSAMEDDGAAFLVAFRRLTRHIMPFAVAVDDCIAVLTPDQLAEVQMFSPDANTFLQIGLMIDTFFDNVFDGRLRQRIVTSRPDEKRAWDIADLEAVADRLHEILEGRTREALEQLSGRLARKVKGARDALQGSADAASQAANSLIEFIDRMLRDAFSDDYALDWLKRNRPNDRSLTYIDNNRGIERPTKRGQALCFIFAGIDPKEEQMFFHDTIASSLNETRRGLQKIKHADKGTPEELEELRRYMASVEGFVIYAIRIGWIGVDEEHLNELRDRLAKESA